MASEIKMKMSLITSGVKTALTGLKTNVANFSRSASEKLNNVAKIVSTGLVTAFALASKSALTYAQEMQNLAKFAGLSFEEFQKLSAGAKTVGIEHDKLADIFKDVEEKMGEFISVGGGGFKDFFDQIAPLVGATKEEFIGLNGNEVLGKYVKYLEEANVSQAQMSFYLENIGSDAKTLAPLYVDLGAKFRQAGDAAVAGGLVMSDATAKNLKIAQDKIDAFKIKAVIKVGELIGGQGQFAGIKQLGAEFMALMAKVGGWMGNAFLGAVKTLTMAMVATVQLVGEKLVAGFEMAVAKLTIKLAPLIKTLGLAFGFDLEIDTAGAKKTLDDLKNTIEPTFAERFYKVGEALGDWTFEVSDQVGYWKAIAKEQGIILTDTKDVEEFIRKQKGGVADVNGKLDIQKKLLKTELELFREINGENYDYIQFLQQQKSDYDDILSLMEKHDISAKEATGHVDEKNKGLARQQALVDALNKAESQGDDRTYTAIKLQLDLHKEAIELQKETGKSYNDAYDTIYKIYILKEGDLDLSGEISKQEKVLHKRKIKILEEQKKTRKEVEKTGSVLRVKLLPNWKDVQKQSKKTFDNLKSSSEIHDILNPKVRNVKKAQGDVTTAVENTNYEHGKSTGLLDSVKDGTGGVMGAEDSVTEAVGRSNAQRQEALRLTNALKNAGGSGSMDINVKTKIGADLSKYLVPHLEKHTELLTSIDGSLKC